jgi:signal transduction histidine kinase/ActR/RegA family two-component response regulator
VLVLVGLVVATTVALTVVSYQSYLDSLETAARAAVDTAVDHREQTITGRVDARRRSAEGLLASATSLCGEPIDGRYGWAVDCIRPLIAEFRVAEGASGAEIRYNRRLLARSGPPMMPLDDGTAAPQRIGRRADGAPFYRLRVASDNLVLIADFGVDEFAPLFDKGIDGQDGSVFLVDNQGHSLIGSNDAQPKPVLSGDAVRTCLGNAVSAKTAPGDQDVVFQAFRPVAAFGNACVAAQLPVDRALAPASILLHQLITGGVLFSVLGLFISLVAARWVAAPVKRLAAAAERLKEGRFEHAISLSGPSEVRALGRALRAMATDLDRRMTDEQNARREAQEAVKAKEELIAVVSHELRTPLSAILGWADILSSHDLDEAAVKRSLEAIRRSAQSQRRLVDDLLDVSRITNNQLRLSNDVVDFTRVVRNAVDTLRPLAARNGVRIKLNGWDSTLLVRGDAERLQQIVINLASNAVKFTPSDGQVEMAVEQTSDSNVRLTVSDTGIGISDTLMPHIFEWFKRGDTARTRRYTGLGVGLGIVRHLVQLHGGDVHAESRGEGQGSTFVVNLPLLKADAPALSTSTELPAPAQKVRLDSVQVLLVEDDAETRHVVSAALEAAGARVTAVASAPDAREALAKVSPDVLLSDIAMPDEDGYSLIRSLRSSNVRVPAIALTAYARPQDVDEAKEAGFQIHLAKPVAPADLVQTVAALASPTIRVA